MTDRDGKGRQADLLQRTWNTRSWLGARPADERLAERLIVEQDERVLREARELVETIRSYHARGIRVLVADRDPDVIALVREMLSEDELRERGSMLLVEATWRGEEKILGPATE